MDKRTTIQEALLKLSEANSIDQVVLLCDEIDSGFVADVQTVHFSDSDWRQWNAAIRDKTQFLEQVGQGKGGEDRIFIGVFSTGISYADRLREKKGDYAKLAFLAFDTLQLTFEKDCPRELKAVIEKDASAIQAKRGQRYQVSTSGQTVLLGGTEKP